MLTAAAAMLLLVLLAVGVTVADAVRASHWRAVAIERRWSWQDEAGDGPTR